MGNFFVFLILVHGMGAWSTLLWKKTSQVKLIVENRSHRNKLEQDLSNN